MAEKSKSGGRTRSRAKGRKPWEKDGPSPNPAGRPRKASKPIHNDQLRADFFHIAQMEVTIPVQGKKRKMTLMEAIIFKEFEQGLNGHAISRRNLMNWYRLHVTEYAATTRKIYKLMLRREVAFLEKCKRDEGGLSPEEESQLQGYKAVAFEPDD